MFVIDAETCTGCQLCVVACKDEHVDSDYAPWTKPQPEGGHFWVGIDKRERGTMPRLRVSFLPIMCQHCENAPCAKVCPHDAIKTRDDGIVWIDPALCNGCGLCQEACPYDVIYINEELDIAQKCTGCAHRVDEGLQPRCADACPHSSILFGEAAEAAANVQGSGTLEQFHPEYGAEPRVKWKGLPRPWIAGIVIDDAADEVIDGAEIVVADLVGDGEKTASTDAFGEFWFRGLTENRKYRVTVRKAGYAEHVAVVTTDVDCDLGAVRLTPAG